MMKREALYIRISHQITGESLDTQESILREISKQENIGNIIKVYKDESKSGYLDDEEINTGFVNKRLNIEIPLDKRPAFCELIDDVYKKKFDILRVIRLDRIARYLVLQEGLFHFFERNGIEIRSLDPTDKLIRRVIGTINEKSSEDTSIRVGFIQKKRFNEGLLWRPFFGYEAIKDGEKTIGYKINPDEADTIRRVFSYKIQKKSILKICELCNIDETRCKRILADKRYAGWFKFKAEEKFIKEYEIIPLELWKQCQ